MRTLASNKTLLLVLALTAFIAAAAFLGAQALSNGWMHQTHAGTVAKKPGGARAREAVVPHAPANADEGATADSWKRWPSLTDF